VGLRAFERVEFAGGVRASSSPAVSSGPDDPCAPPVRGCRAPARRVRGRRVRWVIGDEPGQVNGMRWRVTHR